MTIWPALLQVFGLCWVLVSSVRGESGSNDLNFYGELCQFPTSARCLQGAVCVSPRTCECGDGSDGTFYCPDPLDHHVELTGFMNFQPWNNTLEAPLTLECRTRLTAITVRRQVDQMKCEFQVFGTNKMVDDQVYIDSVELHLQIEQFGDVQYQGAFRISGGKISQDSYVYEERTKSSYETEQAETFTELPDNEDINSGSGMGEFFDDEDDGADSSNPSSDDEDSSDNWSSPTNLGTTAETSDGTVYRSVDKNSVADINIPKCGTKLRFRAADNVLMDVGLRPGLLFVVDPEETDVVYSNHQTYLAGSPQIDDNSNLKTTYGLSQSEAYLHTAFQYSAVQREDDQGETCKDTAFVYRAYCTSLESKMNALKVCSPMLFEQNKRNCLSNSQIHDSPLHVFKRCVWITCQPTSMVCSLFRDEFMAEDCLTNAEKTTIFSNCPVVS